MGEKIKLNDYTAIQKSTAMLAALGFLINSMTASGEITAGDKLNTVVDKGDITNIWAGKVNGENAFNHFNKFELEADKIANMYFKQKDSTNEANRLFNFVDNQIKVEGTVNAIKNNKIGGELFFLSSSGMVVGNTGVINTGALYVMTPTQNAYDDALKEAELGNVYEGIVPKDGNVSIPLNPQGTIIVKGKINAVDRIELHAANITIGDKENPADANGNTVAVLATGVTDFKNLVNMTDEQLAALNTDREKLTAEKTEDGDIVLKAFSDGTSQLAENILSGIESFNDLLSIVGAVGGEAYVTQVKEAMEQGKSLVETIDKLRPVLAEAKIELDSAKIDAAGNFTASATARNIADEENGGGNAIAAVNAEVDIKDSNIKAGENVNIEAVSESIYIAEEEEPEEQQPNESKMTQKLNKFLGQFEVDASVAVQRSVATVNIENSGIEAGENLNIKADNTIKVEIGAEVAPVEQAKKQKKGKKKLAAAGAVIYTDGDAAVNISGEKSVLSSKGDMNINAVSRTDLNLNAASQSAGETFTLGLGVISGNNASKVSIKDKAVLTSERALAVSSAAENNISSTVLVAAEGAPSKKPGSSGGSTRTSGKLGLGTAINVVEHDSSSTIEIDNSRINSSGNMGITSTNTISNTITSDNTMGIDRSKFAKKTTMVEGQFDSFVTKIQGMFGEQAPQARAPQGGGTSTGKGKVQAGAAVGVILEENSSNIKINNSTIETKGDLNISSKTEVGDTKVSITGDTYSGAKKGTGGTTSSAKEGAVSLAVMYSDISNTSSIVIDSQKESTLDTVIENTQLKGANVNITSDVIMQYNRIEKMIEELTDAKNKLSVALTTSTTAEGLVGDIKEKLEEINNIITQLQELGTALKSEEGGLAGGTDSFFSENTLTRIGKIAKDSLTLITELEGLVTGLPTDIPKEIGDEIVEDLNLFKEMVESALAFADGGNYGNFYVRTAANDNNDKGSGLRAAGSVAINNLTNSSTINIGNVDIISSGNLDIKSNVKADTVSIVGNIQDLNIGIFETAGENGKATSVGGSFNMQTSENNSGIIITEKTKLQGNNITIGTDNKVFNVTASLSSGHSGEEAAINGMVSYNNGVNSSVVSIDDEVDITGSNGAIQISASNDASLTNVAGALAQGGNVAIGASAAVNEYDIITKAEIKDNDIVKEETEEKGTISAESLAINAETSGMINAISVAGGVSSDKKSNGAGVGNIGITGTNASSAVGNAQTNANNGLGNLTSGMVQQGMGISGTIQGGNTNTGENGSQNKIDIAGAGSVSINLNNTETSAGIDGVNIVLSGNDDKKNIVVEAKDNGFTGAWSGAAAINWSSKGGSQNVGNTSSTGNNKTKVAVEGAVGLNVLNNTTNAIVNNVKIRQTDSITVNAENNSVVTAAGLGLGLSNDGNTYMGGASVSLNIINHDTTALLGGEETEIGTKDKSLNQDKTNINVTAEESGIQITGGVNIQAGKGKGAAGGAITVGIINNDVTAGIKGGTYHNVGNVLVDGTLNMTQVTAAAAIGVVASGGDGTSGSSSSSASFQGAVVYNEVDNSVNSGISNATITNSDNISVTAGDSPIETGTKNADNTYINYLNDRGIDTDGSDYYSELDLSSTEGDYTKQNADGGYSKKTSESGQADENLSQINDNKKGTTIITAAGVISGAIGSGASGPGVGAGVIYDKINNNFTATIDNSVINTTGDVTAGASADTFIVGAAGGVAASTGKFGAMGSVSWQELANKVSAQIVDSVITADKVAANAKNTAFEVNVGGQISASKGTSIGAVLANSNVKNETLAGIINTEKNKDKQSTEITASEVEVTANSDAEIYTIGAGVSASSSEAIAGTVAINTVNNTTEAIIGREKDKNENNTVSDDSYDAVVLNGIKKLNVKAENNDDLMNVVGGITGSGKVSVGGAVAYSEIDNNVTAEINKANITTAEDAENERAINISADDNSEILNVAVSLGGAGNVAVQGAASTAIVNKKVNAELKDADVDKDVGENVNLNITANNKGNIISNASVVAGAGTAAVGAGVSVNQITQDTAAVLSGGTQKVKEALVKGISRAEITNIGIGVGAGGTAGVTGSVAVNQLENNNKVSIKDGANLTAKGNIGVIAQSDDIISNYAGTLSAAGTAAVGVSTTVNELSGDTVVSIEEAELTAYGATDENIATNGKVNEVVDGLVEELKLDDNLTENRVESLHKGIVADSSSTHTLKSLLANGGFAGKAAVNGTVNVNQISGTTKTNINKSSIFGKEAYIHTGDYTDSIGFVGTVAAAAAAGIGGASDTHLIDRTAETLISGAQIRVTDNVKIDTDSKQGISSMTVAGAAAGAAAVGATVTVTQLEGETKLIISSAEDGKIMTAIEGETVDIDTAHTGIVNMGNVAATGAGTAAVGAAIGVTKDENITETKVSDSTIRAKKQISINTENNSELNNLMISAGVGGVAGVSGVVSVNNISNIVKTDIDNSDIVIVTEKEREGTEEGETSGLINIATINNLAMKVKPISASAGGTAGVAATITVNTINSSTITDINNTNIENFSSSPVDVIIASTENRDIDQLIVSAGVGGVAAGTNVAVNSIGTAIVERDSETDIQGKIEAANGGQGSKIDGLAADILNEKAEKEKQEEDKEETIVKYEDRYKVTADKTGRENTKDEGIKVNISSGRITADNVTIQAVENDNVNITSGGGTVGGISISASVGITDIVRDLGITISNAEMKAAEKLAAEAKINGTASAEIYQGSGGVIGLGAAYSEINAKGNNFVNITGADLLGNSIDISAKDSSELINKASGLSVGVVTGGAIIAKSENESNMGINIESSTIEAAAVTEKTEEGTKIVGGDNNIYTEKTGKLEVTAIGGSAGVLSGVGVEATAKDNSTNIIAIKNSNNKLQGRDLTVSAISVPRIKAETGSVAFGTLAGVGVSNSYALYSGKTSLDIDAGNTIAGDTIKLGAGIITQGGFNSLEAKTIANGGGLTAGVQVNEAKAENNGEATVNIEKQNYYDTSEKELSDVAVSALNNTKIKVTAEGLNIGGAYATGINQATSISTGKTEINVKGGNANIYNINAGTDTEIDSRVKGDGGALISIDGNASGILSNTINNSTVVNIGGNWNVNKEMNVTAKETDTLNLKASSTKGGGLAVNGLQVINNIGNNNNRGTEVNFLNDAKVEGRGSVAVLAENAVYLNKSSQKKVEKTESNPSGYEIIVPLIVDGENYGGVAVQLIKVESDIDKKAEINIGENVAVNTNQKQTYDAKATGEINLRGSGKSGGAGSGTDINIDSDITFNNKVAIGTDAELTTNKADQDITLAANDIFQARVSTIAEADGAVGVAEADSNSKINRNNTIDIAESSKLHSTNNINLYAGKDSAGAEADLTLKVSAETVTEALVGIPLPGFNNSINQKNQININSGSIVESVGSINLEAGTGTNKIEEARQKYTWITGDNKTSDYMQSENGVPNSKVNSDNYVKADGNLSAGIYAKQDIKIDGVFNTNKDVEIIGTYAEGNITGTLNGKVIGKDINIEIKSEDFTNTLMDRYRELERMIAENPEPNSPANLGYKAEQTALLAQMLEAGVATQDKDGNLVPVKNLEISYIEIPDIVASGGDITIKSDNFIGGGSLSATGDPTVTITNKSNLYLKIGDVIIGEAGGKITFNNRDIGNKTIAQADKNEHIKNLNLLEKYKNDEVKFNNILADTTGAGAPMISILNDGITSLKVATDSNPNGDKEAEVTIVSNVEINGNVENTNGKIEIENKTGSIIQISKSSDEPSSIVGDTVSMKAAGSIVQGSSEGMVAVVDEKSRWEDEQKSLQKQLFDGFNNAATGDATKVSDKSNTATNIDAHYEKNNRIAGGTIILSATDININGLVQSGFKDYKVTLGATEEKKISDYDKNWSSNKGSTLDLSEIKANYKLNNGGFKYDEDNNIMYYVVQTYYDPSTKQVIVEDINPTGGQIYLTGRIMSTGNGRIVALDGAADIDITNNMNNNDINLTLGNISNGNSQGKVSITDLNKKDSEGNYLTTEYTTDGGIKYTYTPEEGQRYNWTNGTKSTTTQTYTWSQYFSWWGLRESKSKEELTAQKDKDPQYDVPITLSGAEKEKGYYIETDSKETADFIVHYHNEVNNDENQKVVSDPRVWTDYKNWTHFSGTDYYEWDETFGTTQTYVNSLNASKPIEIEFITSKNGGTINVDSVANVVLNGNLKNTSTEKGIVTIDSDNSIIRKGGNIYSDNINLTAGKDIQNIKITSLGADVNLTANAGGNVSIELKGDYQKAGNAIIGSITGKDIDFSASGNISQKIEDAIGIKGNRINLVSTDGGITLNVNSADELVDIQDSMSTSISAKAKGDITLTEVSGDMRIGRIETLDGSVILNTDGYVLDALPDPNEETSSRADIEEKIENWQSAGLIAGSEEYLAKKTAEAEDYKQGIITEYDYYLALQEYFKETGQPEIQQTEKLEEGKPEEPPVKEKIDLVSRYAELEAKYGQYESVDAYLEEDIKYKELTKEPEFKWTQEDLLYAIKDTIANPEAGSTTNPKAKDPNITGKNITINAGMGIGKDAAETVINLDELIKIEEGKPADYTNMKKLASAEAADVVWDEETGIATISNKKAVGIKLTDSTGKLNVKAGENVYLAVRSGAGEGNNYNAVNVGQITTKKDIRLFGIGGVFNAAGNTNTNFTGNNLILEGGSANLGAENNELTTDLTGTLTARTNESIYINQKSDSDMKVAAIYAGKDIVLKSQSDILSVDGELGYINSVEGNIVLEAEGSIGKDNGEVLRIKNNEIDKNIIIAKAGENIYLAGKNSGSDAETGTGSEVVKGEEPPKGDTEVQVPDNQKGLTLGEIQGNGIVKVLGEANLKVENINNKTEDPNSGITDLNAAGYISLGSEETDTNITTNKLIMTANGEDVNQLATNTINANTVIASANKGINLASNNTFNSIDLTNAINDIIINNTGENGLTVSVNEESEGNAGNVKITNAAGDIKVISDITATGDNSDVTIENTGSIIFAENKNVAADKNVKLTSTEIGNIVVNDINTGNEILVSTNEGSITVNDLTASNITTTTINMGSIKGNNFTATNNITTSANTGDITLANANAKQGNLSASTVDGDISITTGTVLGTAEITAETGNIKVNELTGSKISVTTENTVEELKGNIEIGNVTSTKEEILLATNIGDIKVTGKANAGTELSASTKSGAIDITNAVSGTNMNLTTKENGIITVGTLETLAGNLTAGTSIGDITITTGTVKGTTNISTTVDGNINLGTINSTDDIIAGTNKGTITANDLTSGNNIKVTTNDGFIKGTNFIAANNITTSTNIGDITLDNAEAKQGNLSASTVNGNISIITGTALGTADITTKVGNIDITNLTVDKDVTVKTETEGKITSTGKLTSINESLEVYSAKGDINLNEVYAKDQARVYAKDGDIYIKLINGDYVVITMGSKDHKMDVKEQIVGKGSMLSSNDITISDLSQREGYTTPVEVTFNNSEDNTNSPITRAELHAKGLPNGLLITQLWAKDAEISTDGKILQLPKLNITGIGHFANDTTITTVYGENSGYDNTDISIWNQASLTVPTELQYILLNFTNEPNTIETDGILLKVTDGFKVYAEREAGEEIMLDKLKDFEAEINKSYILNSPFEFVYKPYLNYNLIDNNIENAGMPEIIVTKDKIIISGTKAKEDKEIPIIAVENTEEEEKEKIAQK